MTNYILQAVTDFEQIVQTKTKNLFKICKVILKSSKLWENPLINMYNQYTTFFYTKGVQHF